MAIEHGSTNEQLPKQEVIVLANGYDQFVLERIEKIGRQKYLHRNPLTHERDTATYTFSSRYEDVPQFTFTAGWAKKAYERIDRVLERDLTISGLNDFEWKTDWKNLVEGKLPPAIHQSDPFICDEGHKMTPRFNSHTLCMACGQVKWPNEIT